MNYVLDAHTHTLVSGHAYSTIREMAVSAKEKNLELLCITEHAPAMPGTCHEFYFSNYRVIDRNAYALPLLLGVELNLLDQNGTFDLAPDLLSQMDLAIISIHPPCISPMSKMELTRSLILAMEHPQISIVGHPDDGRFPLDYTELVRAAKETHTLLEVNNSSLLPTSFRPNARANYLEMLRLCMKYDVSVILNSDAHIDTDIGKHQMAQALLEELSFPTELVVNTSVNQFKKFLI